MLESESVRSYSFKRDSKAENFSRSYDILSLLPAQMSNEMVHPKEEVGATEFEGAVFLPSFTLPIPYSPFFHFFVYLLHSPSLSSFQKSQKWHWMCSDD